MSLEKTIPGCEMLKNILTGNTLCPVAHTVAYTHEDTPVMDIFNVSVGKIGVGISQSQRPIESSTSVSLVKYCRYLS